MITLFDNDLSGAFCSHRSFTNVKYIGLQDISLASLMDTYRLKWVCSVLMFDTLWYKKLLPKFYSNDQIKININLKVQGRIKSIIQFYSNSWHNISLCLVYLKEYYTIDYTVKTSITPKNTTLSVFFRFCPQSHVTSSSVFQFKWLYSDFYYLYDTENPII